MSERWKNWAETASRGDVVRIAVHQRTINIHLGIALGAIIAGDDKKASEQLAKFWAADEEFKAVFDEIGGND